MKAMSNAMTLSPSEIAEMMRTDEKSVMEYAKRESDPLPLVVIRGKYSRGFAFVDDFEGWLRRNTVPWCNRKTYKHEPVRAGSKVNL